MLRVSCSTETHKQKFPEHLDEGYEVQRHKVTKRIYYPNTSVYNGFGS
jgi:hypothetical protein